MTEPAKSLGYLHLSNVRASYLYCFEPFTGKPTPQNPNPQSTYTVHGLMPANHPDLPKLAAVIEAVGAAEFKDQWPVIKEALKAQDKLCLHRGDVTKAGAPEYAGLLFISANNKRRPTVVDVDRSPLNAKDGRPYSGCYVNLIVDVWAQNNSFGKRINATVTGIQFVRNDAPLGGGARAADANEFASIAPASADAPAPTAAADPLAGLV